MEFLEASDSVSLSSLPFTIQNVMEVATVTSEDVLSDELETFNKEEVGVSKTTKFEPQSV